MGEIVDDSILFLKQNYKPLFKSYFAICGFFWVAGLIISIFNQTSGAQLQDQSEQFTSPSFLLSVLFGLLNFVMITITCLSFIVLYKEKGNESPSVAEVWAYVQYYLLRAFGTTVMLVLILALGIVCCIIPGIYFAPIFMLILTVMIMENGGGVYSFNRAFLLIKNNWGQVFGVLVVMMLLVLASIMLISIPIVIVVMGILFFTHVNHPQTQALSISISLYSIQFLYMLPIIAIALAYYSLNEIKDDNSLMQRIRMLGKNTEDADDLPLEEY
ncbi:putative membrane spanning protein [Arcticibacter svalbardensis MN12-7]|uniref:Putative membrane spanning protein n=2 Tax=Arcticibacter TaxID=1288026 RepID=R9GUR2_9SPHI|nr:putative membrane spanning protein [Arcticibacter svalbardensis MN12-7]